MTNPDPFGSQAPSQIGPYDHAFAITPQDNVAFQVPYRAIYVGGAGNVTLVPRALRSTVGSSAPGVVTFTNVPAGTTLFVWNVCVMATGTTATNLVGLY